MKIEAGPVDVVRDEYGHWSHPAFPWAELPYEVDCRESFAAWGYDVSYVELAYDAPEDMVDRYFDSNDPDCSYWTPTPPNGDGWFLAAIYDTEDGPVALFFSAAHSTASDEGSV